MHYLIEVGLWLRGATSEVILTYISSIEETNSLEAMLYSIRYCSPVKRTKHLFK